MCNRFGYLHPLSQLEAEVGRLNRPLIFPNGQPNIEPRPDIRPTDTVLALHGVDPSESGSALSLTAFRWGFIPSFHRGPVKAWTRLGTNARSETVSDLPLFRSAFQKRRCLIPASHFVEWTGPKSAKTAWRFGLASGGLFAFAGLWEPALTEDGPIESVALLTTAAGPDMRAYHHRQPVILETKQWLAWLDPDADVAPLFAAGPAGQLKVGPHVSGPELSDSKGHLLL